MITEGIDEVRITETGYVLNGVPIEEDHPGLEEYIEAGGLIMEDAPDESLKGEDLIRSNVEVMMRDSMFRRGQLALLQTEAEAVGMGLQISNILKFGYAAIEEWKNDGDIAKLNSKLSGLSGPLIRGTLDYKYKGATIQQIIIGKLSLTRG